MNDIDTLTTYGDKPEILYHYTDIRGLLGILETNSIWATNIFYLNDAAEYEYPVELMNKEIEKRIEECEKCLGDLPIPDRGVMDITKEQTQKRKKEKEKKYFYKVLKSIIKDIKHYHIYICSFSKNNDQLSQWRGYCPNGNGFSIGFKTLDLEKQMNKHGFKLVKCVYDKDDQKRILKDELDKWSFSRIQSDIKKYKRSQKLEKLEGLGGLNSNDRASLLAILDAAGSMINNIPKIKHPSFIEEIEWRFYYHFNVENINKIKFREGRSMIVPYYDIPLKDETAEIKISDIKVGPTPHPELSMRSVEELLKSKGYKRDGYKIDVSTVTYRTF